LSERLGGMPRKQLDTGKQGIGWRDHCAAFITAQLDAVLIRPWRSVQRFTCGECF